MRGERIIKQIIFVSSFITLKKVNVYRKRIIYTFTVVNLLILR